MLKKIYLKSSLFSLVLLLMNNESKSWDLFKIRNKRITGKAKAQLQLTSGAPYFSLSFDPTFDVYYRLNRKLTLFGGLNTGAIANFLPLESEKSFVENIRQSYQDALSDSNYIANEPALTLDYQQQLENEELYKAQYEQYIKDKERYMSENEQYNKDIQQYNIDKGKYDEYKKWYNDLTDNQLAISDNEYKHENYNFILAPDPITYTSDNDLIQNSKNFSTIYKSSLFTTRMNNNGESVTTWNPTSGNSDNENNKFINFFIKGNNSYNNYFTDLPYIDLDRAIEFKKNLFGSYMPYGFLEFSIKTNANYFDDGKLVGFNNEDLSELLGNSTLYAGFLNNDVNIEKNSKSIRDMFEFAGYSAMTENQFKTEINKSNQINNTRRDITRELILSSDSKLEQLVNNITGTDKSQKDISAQLNTQETMNAFDEQYSSYDDVKNTINNINNQITNKYDLTKLFIKDENGNDIINPFYRTAQNVFTKKNGKTEAQNKADYFSKLLYNSLNYNDIIINGNNYEIYQDNERKITENYLTNFFNKEFDSKFLTSGNTVKDYLDKIGDIDFNILTTSYIKNNNIENLRKKESDFIEQSTNPQSLKDDFNYLINASFNKEESKNYFLNLSDKLKEQLYINYINPVDSDQNKMQFSDVKNDFVNRTTSDNVIKQYSYSFFENFFNSIYKNGFLMDRYDEYFLSNEYSNLLLDNRRNENINDIYKEKTGWNLTNSCLIDGTCLPLPTSQSYRIDDRTDTGNLKLYSGLLKDSLKELDYKELRSRIFKFVSDLEFVDNGYGFFDYYFFEANEYKNFNSDGLEKQDYIDLDVDNKAIPKLDVYQKKQDIKNEWYRTNKDTNFIHTLFGLSRQLSSCRTIEGVCYLKENLSEQNYSYSENTINKVFYGSINATDKQEQIYLKYIQKLIDDNKKEELVEEYINMISLQDRYDKDVYSANYDTIQQKLGDTSNYKNVFEVNNFNQEDVMDIYGKYVDIIIYNDYDLGNSIDGKKYYTDRMKFYNNIQDLSVDDIVYILNNNSEDIKKKIDAIIYDKVMHKEELNDKKQSFLSEIESLDNEAIFNKIKNQYHDNGVFSPWEKNLVLDIVDKYETDEAQKNLIKDSLGLSNYDLTNFFRKVYNIDDQKMNRTELNSALKGFFRLYNPDDLDEAKNLENIYIGTITKDEMINEFKKIQYYDYTNILREIFVNDINTKDNVFNFLDSIEYYDSLIKNDRQWQDILYRSNNDAKFNKYLEVNGIDKNTIKLKEFYNNYINYSYISTILNKYLSVTNNTNINNLYVEDYSNIKNVYLKYIFEDVADSNKKYNLFKSEIDNMNGDLLKDEFLEFVNNNYSLFPDENKLELISLAKIGNEQQIKDKYKSLIDKIQAIANENSSNKYIVDIALKKEYGDYLDKLSVNYIKGIVLNDFAIIITNNSYNGFNQRNEDNYILVNIIKMFNEDETKKILARTLHQLGYTHQEIVDKNIGLLNIYDDSFLQGYIEKQNDFYGSVKSKILKYVVDNMNDQQIKHTIKDLIENSTSSELQMYFSCGENRYWEDENYLINFRELLDKNSSDARKNDIINDILNIDFFLYKNKDKIVSDIKFVKNNINNINSLGSFSVKRLKEIVNNSGYHFNFKIDDNNNIVNLTGGETIENLLLMAKNLEWYETFDFDNNDSVTVKRYSNDYIKESSIQQQYNLLLNFYGNFINDLKVKADEQQANNGGLKNLFDEGFVRNDLDKKYTELYRKLNINMMYYLGSEIFIGKNPNADYLEINDSFDYINESTILTKEEKNFYRSKVYNQVLIDKYQEYKYVYSHSSGDVSIVRDKYKKIFVDEAKNLNRGYIGTVMRDENLKYISNSELYNLNIKIGDDRLVHVLDTGKSIEDMLSELNFIKDNKDNFSSLTEDQQQQFKDIVNNGGYNFNFNINNNEIIDIDNINSLDKQLLELSLLGSVLGHSNSLSNNMYFNKVKDIVNNGGYNFNFNINDTGKIINLDSGKTFEEVKDELNFVNDTKNKIEQLLPEFKDIVNNGGYNFNFTLDDQAKITYLDQGKNALDMLSELNFIKDNKDKFSSLTEDQQQKFKDIVNSGDYDFDFKVNDANEIVSDSGKSLNEIFDDINFIYKNKDSIVQLSKSLPRFKDILNNSNFDFILNNDLTITNNHSTNSVEDLLSDVVLLKKVLEENDFLYGNTKPFEQNLDKYGVGYLMDKAIEYGYNFDKQVPFIQKYTEYLINSNVDEFYKQLNSGVLGENIKDAVYISSTTDSIENSYKNYSKFLVSGDWLNEHRNILTNEYYLNNEKAREKFYDLVRIEGFSRWEMENYWNSISYLMDNKKGDDYFINKFLNNSGDRDLYNKYVNGIKEIRYYIGDVLLDTENEKTNYNNFKNIVNSGNYNFNFSVDDNRHITSLASGKTFEEAYNDIHFIQYAKNAFSLLSAEDKQRFKDIVNSGDYDFNFKVNDANEIVEDPGKSADDMAKELNIVKYGLENIENMEKIKTIINSGEHSLDFRINNDNQFIKREIVEDRGKSLNEIFDDINFIKDNKDNFSSLTEDKQRFKDIVNSGDYDFDFKVNDANEIVEDPGKSLNEIFDDINFIKDNKDNFSSLTEDQQQRFKDIVNSGNYDFNFKVNENKFVLEDFDSQKYAQIETNMTILFNFGKKNNENSTNINNYKIYTSEEGILKYINGDFYLEQKPNDTDQMFSRKLLNGDDGVYYIKPKVAFYREDGLQVSNFLNKMISYYEQSYKINEQSGIPIETINQRLVDKGYVFVDNFFRYDTENNTIILPNGKTVTEALEDTQYIYNNFGQIDSLHENEREKLKDLLNSYSFYNINYEEEKKYIDLYHNGERILYYKYKDATLNDLGEEIKFEEKHGKSVNEVFNDIKFIYDNKFVFSSLSAEDKQKFKDIVNSGDYDFNFKVNDANEIVEDSGNKSLQNLLDDAKFIKDNIYNLSSLSEEDQIKFRGIVNSKSYNFDFVIRNGLFMYNCDIIDSFGKNYYINENGEKIYMGYITNYYLGHDYYTIYNNIKEYLVSSSYDNAAVAEWVSTYILNSFEIEQIVDYIKYLSDRTVIDQDYLILDKYYGSSFFEGNKIDSYDYVTFMKTNDEIKEKLMALLTWSDNEQASIDSTKLYLTIRNELIDSINNKSNVTMDDYMIYLNYVYGMMMNDENYLKNKLLNNIDLFTNDQMKKMIYTMYTYKSFDDIKIKYIELLDSFETNKLRESITDVVNKFEDGWQKTSLLRKIKDAKTIEELKTIFTESLDSISENNQNKIREELVALINDNLEKEAIKEKYDYYINNANEETIKNEYKTLFTNLSLEKIKEFIKEKNNSLTDEEINDNFKFYFKNMNKDELRKLFTDEKLQLLMGYIDNNSDEDGKFTGKFEGDIKNNDVVQSIYGSEDKNNNGLPDLLEKELEQTWFKSQLYTMLITGNGKLQENFGFKYDENLLKYEYQDYFNAFYNNTDGKYSFKESSFYIYRNINDALEQNLKNSEITSDLANKYYTNYLNKEITTANNNKYYAAQVYFDEAVSMIAVYNQNKDKIENLVNNKKDEVPEPTKPTLSELPEKFVKLDDEYVDFQNITWNSDLQKSDFDEQYNVIRKETNKTHSFREVFQTSARFGAQYKINDKFAIAPYVNIGFNVGLLTTSVSETYYYGNFDVHRKFTANTYKEEDGILKHTGTKTYNILLNMTPKQSVVSYSPKDKKETKVGFTTGIGADLVIKDRFLVGLSYRFAVNPFSNGYNQKTHNVGVKFGIQIG